MEGERAGRREQHADDIGRLPTLDEAVGMALGILCLTDDGDNLGELGFVRAAGAWSVLAPNFTGIGSPYEAPAAPDIRIAGVEESPEAAAARIVEWFFEHQRRTL